MYGLKPVPFSKCFSVTGKPHSPFRLKARAIESCNAKVLFAAEEEP